MYPFRMQIQYLLKCTKICFPVPEQAQQFFRVFPQEQHNTSKDKKLKFTIKENIKSCLFDSDNKKPIWKNVKTNSSDRFKILEPGEETSLGFDKYRIYINNEYDKDNYFDDKDREARNYINSCSYLLDYSSKHEEYYCEFSYEIVGARQTKE